MVAISLYRGNLHRVPDVSRRWLMPTPKISLKDFKVLLHRRSKALSRLRSSNTTANTIATTSNPNPDSEQEEGVKHDDNSNGDPQLPRLEPPKVEDSDERELKEGGSEEEEVKDQKGSDGGDCSVKPADGSDTSPEDKHVILENATDLVDPQGTSQDEKTEAPVNPNPETSNKEDALNDKEKRKREVEEKLQILNAKKHNLVLVLKQILNAEEELKRRSSMQGMVVRPSVQVDASNDSASLPRLVVLTHKNGSDGNLSGDMEGGEADDILNHNMHSRHLIRMSSTSPSSDSPYRRLGYNAVQHPSRPTLGVASSPSPSRFAPTGQQVHPANLPTVSVSGTNYMASSPSPAASGGTSVFRDGRLPSPWN